ncbi:MAG: GWxTD domain-containing protein [Candidatus Marinimicrobia bacterium]|nr:GWxTD domain-containing protein [Candidatus Neomarinimicrobiota bacterium]
MKTKTCLIAMIMFVSIITPVFAVDFDLDYAVFRGSDNNDIVEVYLMIPRTLFEFSKVENAYRSNGHIRIAFAQNDTVRDMKEWSIVDQANELINISDAQKIPEMITVSMPEGKFRIIAIVMDLTSKKKYRKEKLVDLKKYSRSELQISDIQLSAQVSKTATQNKFSKYFGYDIIPNASNIFGSQNKKIHGFCEVYNLDYDKSSDGKYKVQYSITDLNGNIVTSLDWMPKKKPGTSAVELNSIDIQDLSSGLYDFKITVIDESVNQQSESVKRFYIMKNDREELFAKTLEESNLSALTEKQLDEIFGPMKYYAIDKEIRRYRKSDIEGKRNIISKFWIRRDPDPSTPINEAQAEFQQRLQYVDGQFSTPRRKGWKTDLGRVFLIYGAPSEIERCPSSIEAKPYQVWHYYEIEGGVQFIFVDKTGFGQMELVHSTARNELQDYQWQRWVSPTSSSMDQYRY